MLPSTIYSQSLFLFGIQSVINVHAAPADNGIVLRLDTPEVIAPGAAQERRFAEPEPIEMGLPEILPRALSAGQTEGLRLHNVARAKKNLKPLIWDPNLWANASAYAQKMAKSGVFAHSSAASRPNQGENLAYAWSSGTINMPIVVGTNGWLAEEPNYKNQPIPQGDFEKYGHYTQIMWNTTLRVGLATASNGKGAWYTVARYAPAGNIYGRKPY